MQSGSQSYKRPWTLALMMQSTSLRSLSVAWTASLSSRLAVLMGPPYTVRILLLRDDMI